MNTQSLRIDLVSDVVCPWCIIGYTRLQKALELLGDKVEAEIHWHPFELNPQMPQGGQNTTEHVIEKYGITAEQSAKNRENIVHTAAELGIKFNFTPESRIYNTFKAHQLLHFATEKNKETELKLRLFSAFFTEGKAIDEVEVLIQEAISIGLDEIECRAILTDGRYENIVREHEQFWTKNGIQSVPTFVFNNRYAISGAYEATKLVEIIENILSEE